MTTQSEIDRLKWFHAIDFGKLRSAGRIPPSQPPNFTLFGAFRFLEHIDVAGLDVIDIGTMDGLVAFSLKKLGASRVVATDLWDRRHFRLGRDILGYENEVSYRTGLDIRDMEAELGKFQFDLMICAGVLYHLISPLEYLLHCRRLLKPGGLAVFETCYDPTAERMSVRFNQGMETPAFAEPTTYFLPSEDALLAMIRTASFDCLGGVRLAGGSKRITILARAAKPSEVRGKTDLQRKHDAYCNKEDHFAYGNRFYELEHGAVASSRIEYTGELDRFEDLDIRTYRPRIPLQPSWQPPAK